MGKKKRVGACRLGTEG